MKTDRESGIGYRESGCQAGPPRPVGARSSGRYHRAIASGTRLPQLKPSLATALAVALFASACALGAAPPAGLLPTAVRRWFGRHGLRTVSVQHGSRQTHVPGDQRKTAHGLFLIVLERIA